ncbi:MAG: glutaredoxin domain-containing protein [Mobilicoccus sp.]|nr:glutaredoxin domain-containing protein [Mobilicoccus sp.]
MSASHPIVPEPGHLTVYLTSWCPYCSMLVTDLTGEVPFTSIDVDEDRDAAEAVKRINGGNRTVPTVVFPDGTTATNPSFDTVLLRLAR